MRAVAPELEDIHVARIDADTFWKDTAKMFTGVLDQMVERTGEETGKCGLGDVDKDMLRIRYF